MILPPCERLILTMLIERPRYGRELVKDSRGELAQAGVYVFISRLQKKGLVHADAPRPAPPRKSGPGRRVWHPTDLGRQVIAELERTFVMSPALANAILVADDALVVTWEDGTPMGRRVLLVDEGDAWRALVAKAHRVIGPPAKEQAA